MFLFTSLDSPGGVPAPLPNPYVGARFALDFVNGLYFVNDVAYPVGDLIDHPEWITASGLEIRFANETTRGSGLANLIGPALAAFIPDPVGTFMCEIGDLGIDPFNSSNTLSNGAMIFWAMDGDGTPYTGYNDQIISQWSSGPNNGDGCSPNWNTEQANNNLNQRFTADFISGGFGGVGVETIHRWAMSRTYTTGPLSFEGRAVVQDENGSTVPQGAMAITHCAFGANPGDWLYAEFNFRKFVFYPLIADADLPALSAL